MQLHLLVLPSDNCYLFIFFDSIENHFLYIFPFLYVERAKESS